ncbi:MAG: shikimate kinase [Gemmatimonadales bacterium]
MGLPGSGKSSVARGVGELLGRQVLDFDAEIERREHMQVAEIFGSRGEAHFRALERALTEELREMGGMVLSPGAGWIANEGCLAMLRPPAVTVYLQVRPEVAIARMGGAAADRPLLRRADPAAEVRRLLEAREAMYMQSDHTVSTNKMTQQAVVHCIVALARA